MSQLRLDSKQNELLISVSASLFHFQQQRWLKWGLGADLDRDCQQNIIVSFHIEQFNTDKQIIVYYIDAVLHNLWSNVCFVSTKGPYVFVLNHDS